METLKGLRWLKQVEDEVAMGEPLVELETDKAVRHEVVVPAKCARKRHTERHAFDAFNLQQRRHRTPN